MRIARYLRATALLAVSVTTIPAMAAAQGLPPVEVRASAHQDVSPALRDMPVLRSNAVGTARHALRLPRPAVAAAGAAAPQRALAPNATSTPGLNFDGVGQGFAGPAGTFTVNSAPPDTIGAVGATQYLQAVNSEFAVFNKATGAVVFGPVPLNTLWSGFGGGCESNNDGDPIVAYDKQADRWIISQFSVSTTPFLQCVAISTSSDATGTYARYSFSYTGFNDYPKLGVWPDAYYITYNMFNAAGTSFLGSQVCAFDRAKMLTGTPATQQCVQLSSTFGGLLPADLDGATLPPAGAPNPLVALGRTTSTLDTWKFHVDWATPANTTLAGPTTLTVPLYSEACGGGTCIPQLGTTQTLDSLGDRLMHRLAYRNFGDHEALVVNHAVATGSTVGVRWYELRNPTTTPSLFQTGLFAPDAFYRWMGSIAMDKAGNMALGYSVSGSTINPAIRYAGRLAGDAAGQMTFEATIFQGAGSQTTNLSRWGDYSAMTLDPADDCTFFYTSEYIPSNGTFNWKTRIASFKLTGCGDVADFGIAASPTSISVQQGQSGTSAISTSVVSGSPGVVTLGVSGAPAGSSASISPTSVTAGAGATLTFNAGTATPGLYTLNVTGTSGATSHSTLVSVTVLPPPPPDFSLSASPNSLSLLQGQSGSSTVSTQIIGSSGTVSLSVSGVPAGATASLSPSSVAAGGSSTLSVNAGTAVPGTYVVTVTGQEGSATHSVAVSVTIAAAVVPDFSITATPATLSAVRRTTATSIIGTAVVAGAAGTVNLSLSGVSNRITASLSPSSVTAGSSSTLTLDLSRALPGTYTITVTGVEGSKTHTTTVLLTVTRH